MRPHSIILDLPPELIHVVLESCRSLSDLHSLSGSCQHLRNIFIAKKVYYYDTILRRTLPAFEDALRTQRASVSSIRHLTHLGYASNNLQSMLPPIGTELIDTPTICRFDIDKGEYINIPTENDIVKLGTTPIASAWEAQHVVQLHKIVSKCLHLARCGQIDMWFTHVRVWPIEMEERFYRGAYRYWMFGHLFYPGCYMEPFIVERERLDDATLPRFGEQWSFSDGQEWEMEKYPLFIPDLNSNLRKKHVERLFDGFIAWIVYDAEERAGNKQARELQMRYSPHLRSGRRRNPPVDPGGVAELLLIHTMSMCLDELAARRNREPATEVPTAKFAAFHTGGDWEIRIWQTEKNGNDSDLTTFRSRPQLQMLTPNSLLVAIEPPDAESSMPQGFPALEVIDIGLYKYYATKFKGLWAWEGYDYPYQMSGGVVSGYMENIPLKHIEDQSPL